MKKIIAFLIVSLLCINCSITSYAWTGKSKLKSVDEVTPIILGQEVSIGDLESKDYGNYYEFYATFKSSYTKKKTTTYSFYYYENTSTDGSPVASLTMFDYTNNSDLSPLQKCSDGEKAVKVIGRLEEKTVYNTSSIPYNNIWYKFNIIYAEILDSNPVQNNSEQSITTVDINNYDSWLKNVAVGDYYSFSGTAIYVSNDYYGKGYICVRLFNTKTNNKECRIIIYTTKDTASKISVDDMVKVSGKCTGRDGTNLPIITTNDISIIK